MTRKAPLAIRPTLQALTKMGLQRIRIADYKDSKGKTVKQAENYLLDPEDITKIVGTLTPREKEIAFFTVQGFSCAYIAEKLVVSNSTVRFHQQNLYRKFDVHSRNELIEFVNGPGGADA